MKALKTLAQASVIFSAAFLAACSDDSGSVEEKIDIGQGRIWVQASHLKAKGKGQLCILYVHGNSAPASTFFKDIFALHEEKGGCVITFDLPGHGKSDRFPETYKYSVMDMAAALGAVVKHFSLENRDYVVLGWSYGGDLAMQAMHKGMLPGLKGLMIYGTAPFSIGRYKDLPAPYNAHSVPAVDQAIKGGFAWRGDLSKSQISAFSQALWCKNNVTPDQCSVPVHIREAVQKTDPRIRDGIRYSIQKENIAKLGLKDEVWILATTSVPFAILYGANDSYTDENYMKAVHGIVKGTLIEIPNAGHSAITRQSEVMYRVITSQIQKLAR